MNALQRLANGMSGKDAIALAWKTCPSKVSVKHPDGASVKASIKAGATGTEIANEIVSASATIKRGEGLSVSRKLPSKRADVTGSQSAELDKLDKQAHAAICGEFAEAFGASDDAIEQAASKILSRTQAFERELEIANRLKLAEQARINHERAIALKVRLNNVVASPDDKETIALWIEQGELDQAQSALDECAASV